MGVGWKREFHVVGEKTVTDLVRNFKPSGSRDFYGDFNEGNFSHEGRQLSMVVCLVIKFAYRPERYTVGAVQEFCTFVLDATEDNKIVIKARVIRDYLKFT